MTPRSGVRPEIQALRALAVLLVVVYHFWPGVVRGGYVGVDVFFAVSGYLITAHLLKELRSTGRVQVLRFWARRVRRLIPASLLVLSVTAVAVFVWVPRIYWQQFFSEIAAATLYVQNWLLASNSVDYLAANNIASPAQHYWSLSVEEQFYFVWPLLIVAAVFVTHRLSASHQVRAVVLTLAVVTLASFIYAVVLTAQQPGLAYFVTPTRAWEFGAGALLAAVATRKVASPNVRAVGSWLGILLILASALLYTGATPFPGTAAVVPVAGTLLVIWAGAPSLRWSPSALMRIRPVQFFGDISYSVYLWHWSLLVIAKFALREDLGLLAKTAIVVATVVLAILTKKFVEDPFRSPSRSRLAAPQWTFVTAAAAMALVVAIPVTGWTYVEQETAKSLAVARILADSAPPCFGAGAMIPGNNCPQQDPLARSVPAFDVASEDGPQFPDCWSTNQDSELKSCELGTNTQPAVPRIALVGDSHGLALLPAFEAIVDSGGLRVDTFLKAGCPWSTNIRDSSDAVFVDACTAWKISLEAELKKGDYDAIVTTAYSRTSWAVGSDGVGDLEAYKAGGFSSAWEALESTQTPILAILDVPTFNADPIECLGQASRDGRENSTCDVLRPVAFGWIDPLIAAVSTSQFASAIDLTDLMCTDVSCPAVIGGVTVFRDKDHLTATFARTLAPYLAERINAALRVNR